MDTDGASSAGTNDDDVARLVALTVRKHELWDQLSDCEDETLRNRLFDELAANREEIANLKETANVPLDDAGDVATPGAQPRAAHTSEQPTSIGETLRANLVKPAEEAAEAAQPVRETAEITSSAAPEQNEDEAHASRQWLSASSETEPAPAPVPELAQEPEWDPAPAPIPTQIPTPIQELRQEPEPQYVPEQAQLREPETPDTPEEPERSGHDTYQDLKRVRPVNDRPLPVYAIIAAVGVLAIFGWLLFLRPGGSAETTDPTATANAEGESQVVDQIHAVLDGLGYGSILVDQRSDTIYLAGVVPTDSDRSSAISASEALAGNTPLNSSGLTVAGEEGSVALPTTTLPPSDPGGEDPQPVVTAPVVAGPYIEATLDGKDFVLAGVVPSAALASTYLRAAEVAYSPYVRSELVVDEQLESVDWLATGPNAIVLLPMIIDGTILIADGQVQLSGRAPDDAGVARLQGALGQTTGLPVVVADVEVMNLAPPSYVMAADAGVIELSGQIPSEEIRDLLVAGAAAAYGDGNVVDRITVDPGVYPSLWMYSGGPLMQAMSTFPDYQMRIDGMAFSGFINGGVDFVSGSATFSGNYALTLDVGVSVLTRDPSLRLVIEGHTDDRGSSESNLALSQARAEAVRDYFIANGIDPSRLTAIGIGEAQPVVPNDSEAGRARNRRIQYVLTSALSSG